MHKIDFFPPLKSLIDFKILKGRLAGHIAVSLITQSVSACLHLELVILTSGSIYYISLHS